MPFVQMENVSHFLRACEAPPLNMPAHDRFLTVDLFEAKDPAQVLQCLSAFSRVANNVNPSRFPSTLGPRKTTPMSPSHTGGPRSSNTSPYVTSASFARPLSTARPLSPMKTGDSTTSSNAGSSRNPKSPVSTWSKKGDEGMTTPAWNILQYGYMGGASQSNQGISFGGRRQITSAGSDVPNGADKERRRKEQADEEERRRHAADEAQRKQQADRVADEERERLNEEKRWEDETRRQRDLDRNRLAEQKRQWEEEERKWKAEEAARQTEQAHIDKVLSNTSLQRPRGLSDARLNGQFLSQYQAEQKVKGTDQVSNTPESRRVQDLERQLEEAKERERRYQSERAERVQADSTPSQSIPQPTTEEPEPIPPSPKDSHASWSHDDKPEIAQVSQRHTPMGVGSTRPLPVPTKSAQNIREVTPTTPVSDARRYDDHTKAQSSVDQYLAQDDSQPLANDRASDTTASPQVTKTSTPSKSLLEREMERERERQREWEAEQTTRTRPATRLMGPRPRPT